MGLEIMNKIVLDKEKLVVDNLEAIIELKKNNFTLECTGKNKIIIKNKEILNLNIIMQDNSFLDILIYSKLKRSDNIIHIVQNNNTIVNYKESFISKENTNIKVLNEIKGVNNKTNIIYRLLSRKENIKIDVLAKVFSNSKDNELVEDIKGIMDGGKITILPNMEIDTCYVSANHYVTIGSVNNDELFYLESKGISKNIAKEIIIEGFLKSIFKNDKIILFGGEINE